MDCRGYRLDLLWVLSVSLGAVYCDPWRTRTFRCFDDSASVLNGYYESVSEDNRVIKAYCLPGYHLGHGSAIRHCSIEEQRFSGTPPICVDIDECALMEEGSGGQSGDGGEGSGGQPGDGGDDDNDLRHCHRNATCVNTNGSYTCICQQGLIGNGFSCREPECLQPQIDNGNVKLLGFRGNIAVVSCHGDYHRIGPSLLTCTKRRWPRLPYCRPKPRCPDPTPVKYGEISGDRFYRGNAIHYVCKTGYRLVGPSRRECTRTLNWSPSYSPICKEPESLGNMALKFREMVEEMSRNSASGKQHLSVARFSLIQPNGIDLFLLFDGSSSVGSHNFKRGVNFTDILLTELGVSNTTGTTRVAAIAFGSETNIAIELGSCGTTEEVRQRLSVLEPPGGGTNLRQALQAVDRMILLDKIKGNYVHQKRIMFIMSDGRSNVGSERATETVAKSLRKLKNVEIYTIGVGMDVDRRQLSEFASRPIQEHVYLLENYRQLNNLRDLVLDRRMDYEQCGISGNTELVGNKGDTKDGSWPWLVQIYQMFDGGPERMVCAGTLICQSWVLTAAQCFKTRAGNGQIQALSGDKFRVRVGVHNWTEENPRVLTIAVSEIYRYETELRDDLTDDIALVRLKYPVKLAKYYRTVCVPRNDSQEVITRAPWRVHDEKKLYVAGWGAGSLLSAQLPPFEVPKQQLTKIHRMKWCTNLLRNLTEHSANMSCIGERGFEACRGDVGGPVMTERSGDRHFIQVGVVSYNTNCETPKRFTVMTNTLTYLDWIRRTTAGCVLDHNCRAQQCRAGAPATG